MSPRAGLTPEAVVTAAATVADRGGLDALTLGAVAGELGVRPPSLYNHVAGLDGLRRALCLRALTELGDVVRRAAVGRSGADGLRAIAHAFRRFAHDHPGLYAATVPTSEIDDDAVRRTGAEVVATVGAVVAGLGLAGDEVIHATRILRSAVHGFVHLETHDGFGIDVDLDTSFDRLVEVVLAGLSAAG